MARFGAEYLQWAPFSGDEATADATESAYPKYGAPLNLGALVVVNDNPIFATADNPGDNGVQEQVSEFQKIEIELEITELGNPVASAIFGAEITEGGDVEYGTEDEAPYGGLGLVTCKKVGKTTKWAAAYYPKVKASPVGVSYNTKGNGSITFVNGKAHFTGLACKKNKWKVDSKDFTTKAEAKAWVDDKVKQTV